METWWCFKCDTSTAVIAGCKRVTCAKGHAMKVPKSEQELVMARGAEGHTGPTAATTKTRSRRQK